MIEKKKITAFIFINLCILFFAFFAGGFLSVIDASAQEIEQNTLNETIEEQVKLLDLKALQEYIDSLGVFNDKSVAERLLEYIKCDSVNYEGIGRQISTVLFAKVTELLPSFACMAAITLLSGLITTMKSGTAGSTAADMIFLVTYAAALIPLLVVLTECFRVSLKCISAMQTQMQLVFPLMLTLRLPFFLRILCP